MSHVLEAPLPEVRKESLPRRRSAERRTSTFATTQAMRARMRIEERRLHGDRRQNQFQHWRTIVLGGLPVAVVNRRDFRPHHGRRGPEAARAVALPRLTSPPPTAR